MITTNFKTLSRKIVFTDLGLEGEDGVIFALVLETAMNGAMAALTTSGAAIEAFMEMMKNFGEEWEPVDDDE